jgi:hypothetical protein
MIRIDIALWVTGENFKEHSVAPYFNLYKSGYIIILVWIEIFRLIGLIIVNSIAVFFELN